MERGGEMLLLRDAKSGKLLLLPAERKAEVAERKRAKSLAATYRLLATNEAERLAHETAEAEVAKLKAELVALRKGK